MSSLAETYALQIGVKIDKPDVLEKFFPLEDDYSKVVLIQSSASSGNVSAKCYDYFNEVISLIRPELDKSGYKIYQIGGPNEQPLKNVNSLVGKTSFHQLAFLLKKCALLISNDSMAVHLAGSYSTPIVCVYGPTDVKNHGPYWKGEKTLLIESHRFGNKRPSYTNQENPKTINQIPPEEIANGVLKLLGLDSVSRKSLYFGDFFIHTVVDIYPDAVIDPNFAKEAVVNIRMDYLHNEEILKKTLALRKCVVVMDKPINLDIFKQFKQNVVGIKCKINPTFPKWIIREIKKLGIQHIFYTENLDDETVAKMRLEYFDYCFFDSLKDKTKENFESSVSRFLNKKLDEKINYNKLWFSSNKYIISSKGAFISKPALDANKPIENFDFSYQPVIDNPEFWKDQEHFYVYEK